MWVYSVLAFTWPKAGREVGPLNWTQEHRSVWYGPPSKAMGHAPRPVHDWPVPLSYHRPVRRRARERGPQAIVQASMHRPWGLSRNPAWGRGTPFPPLLLSCPFTSSSFALYYFFPFLFTLPIFFYCPSHPFLTESSHSVSRPEVVGGDRTWV